MKNPIIIGVATKKHKTTSLKEPMPLKSHFSYCLLNNIGLNKFVSCGKFEIYAVCLLNAIGNERKKAEEMSRSG